MVIASLLGRHDLAGIPYLISERGALPSICQAPCLLTGPPGGSLSAQMMIPLRWYTYRGRKDRGNSLHLLAYTRRAARIEDGECRRISWSMDSEQSLRTVEAKMMGGLVLSACGAPTTPFQKRVRICRQTTRVVGCGALDMRQS